MPELPDIQAYLDALVPRILGHPVERIRLTSPFVLRSVEPPLSAAEGHTVVGLRRLGKRIVIELDTGLFLVLHLMIAGRLRWEARGKAVPRKIGLGAIDFPTGTLILTEAGSKKRASLHVVRGAAALAAHDRGGLEVLDASLEAFAAVVRCENHTLKRTLTDPSLLSGIGNAYSDEILHRARLSPLKLTSKLTDVEVARLHEATQATLREWIQRLGEETVDAFPTRVTAFREGMAVHGRFGKPCPECNTPVQRIVYVDNECNYCPTCQTGGRLLADRGLSRLLKEDWPKNLDEWEQHMEQRRR